MNQDQLFEKLLETLKSDLAFYKDMIKEVAMDMIKEGYTQFPIFIAHQHEVSLGEPILIANDYARDFNINATTMEELIKKQLILADKADEFKQNYKNPSTDMCVLLITVSGAHFIFVPYNIKAA